MSVTSSSDHSNQEREVWLVVRTIGAWPGRARAGAEFYHQVWFSQQPPAATKSHKKRGVVGCSQAVSRHKSPSFYLTTRAEYQDEGGHPPPERCCPLPSRVLGRGSLHTCQERYNSSHKCSRYISTYLHSPVLNARYDDTLPIYQPHI